MSRVFRTQTKAPRSVQGRRTSQRNVEAFLDPEVVIEEAQSRAREILAGAQVEAAYLTEQAEVEARKTREDAHAKGLTEGLRDGREAGFAQAAQIISEAGEALGAAREAFEKMASDAEPKMLALALDTARQVASEGLSADPAVALDLIRKGMRAVKDEREFSLHVDPALLALVEGASPDLARDYGARSLEVVPDDAARSGAIIHTPHGFVDVTLESQIRNIATALAESRKRAQEELR